MNRIKSLLGKPDQEDVRGKSIEETKQKLELETLDKQLKIRKSTLKQAQFEINLIKSRKEESINLIEQDLPRTFSKDMLFAKSGVFYENLQKVLEAFAMYRPDIGYI